MTKNSKGRPDIWGPIGLMVTLLLSALGFWVLKRPKLQDPIAYALFSCSVVLLLVVVTFTLYKPFHMLKRNVELVYDYIERTTNTARTTNSISWQQFSLLVLDLLSQLLFQRYTPDLVIGIGRSGGIVASILAGCLGSCPILVVDVDIDRETGIHSLRSESQKALQSIPGTLKVLIAMADVITGESIRQVRENLPDSVQRKVATLYKQPSVRTGVDFSILGGPNPPEWPFRLTSSFRYRFYNWPGRQRRVT